MNDSLTSFLKIITFSAGTIGISCIAILALIIGIIIKKRREGLCIFLVTLFNFIVSEIIKNIIQRPRPEVLRLIPESSFSFPSGHSLVSTSFCGILIYLILKSEMNKNLKVILTVLLALFPILVGISRIYLGVHYPSDVLGGYLIGILLLFIEISIIEKKHLL